MVERSCLLHYFTTNSQGKGIPDLMIYETFYGVVNAVCCGRRQTVSAHHTNGDPDVKTSCV